MKKPTKLYKKRIEILKEIAYDGEVYLSKRGSYYCHLKEPDRTVVNTKYNYSNVTKSTINRLGESFTYPSSDCTIVTLSKANKLSLISNKSIKSLTSKVIKGSSFTDKLLKIFLYNKKAEWIKDNPKWFNLRIATQFSSLKEMKNWFGYDFISCSKFEEFFTVDKWGLLCYSKGREDLANIISTKTSSNEIEDSLRMSKYCGVDIKIHKSKEKNKKNHDYLVKLYNLKKKTEITQPKYEYETEFFNRLTEIGLEWEHLNTEYLLLEEGKRQYHCIGSKGSSLRTSLFLSILYKDKRYSLEIKDTRSPYSYGKRESKIPVLLEIRGKYNSVAPIELIKLIKDNLLSFKITVKKNVETTNLSREVLNLDFADLVW